MHTQVYLDVYIAVECFHIRYPQYMRETTSDERTLYSLFLMLKGEKERYAMEQSQKQADAERQVGRAIGNGYRA